MQKVFKISALMLTATLAACGGGGGSSGETQESYSIKLRADKTQLPLNVGSVSAGIGVYSPFTTTVYVDASMGGRPIPGGEDIFSCNVPAGLDSGSLYYLNGDDTHMTDADDGNGGTVKIPKSYRSITLGANSGGNSFHFHSGNQVGTTRITCTVTDPRDKQVRSASVDITVGGVPTGRAASIQGVALFPLLGTQGNLNNLRTNTVIQAYVLDDANQPVLATGTTNLQVAIVASGGASSGARLLAGAQSGSVVWVNTNGGVGTFSLASGTNEGQIMLQMVSDRFDNDVSNGIQDPITAYLVVNTTEGAQPEEVAPPLTLVDVTPPGAANGLPYSYVLSAQGGVAPYTWTALGALPAGLSLSSSGVLSGTPNMKAPGTVAIAVRVTDSRGTVITGNLSLVVTGTAEVDSLAINLSGCSSDVNAACALPDATIGSPYVYVLTASGGGAGDVTWAFEPAASPLLWLTLTSSGTLQGTAPSTQCGLLSSPFWIKATKGTVSTMRKVTIKGVPAPGGIC